MGDSVYKEDEEETARGSATPSSLSQEMTELTSPLNACLAQLQAYNNLLREQLLDERLTVGNSVETNTADDDIHEAVSATFSATETLMEERTAVKDIGGDESPLGGSALS